MGLIHNYLADMYFPILRYKQYIKPTKKYHTDISIDSMHETIHNYFEDMVSGSEIRFRVTNGSSGGQE